MCRVNKICNYKKYFITFRPDLEVPQKMQERGICVLKPLNYIKLSLCPKDWNVKKLVIMLASKKSLYVALLLGLFPIVGKRIFYYWDCVESDYPPNPLLANKLLFNWELWSFDKKDCEKYSMAYNSQFYFSNQVVSKSDELLYDAFYIGFDRGRYDTLDALRKELENCGFTTDFHIVADDSSIKISKRNYSGKLSYEEVLDKISKSKAIVEVTMPGQSGLTLRSVECFFHGKKLITTNSNIVTEPAYRPNNVYVIGEERSLEEFMELPYQTIDEDDLFYYEFDQWIKRFDR